jgi:hypothetical protein
MAAHSFTITIRVEVTWSLVFCRFAAGTTAAALAEGAVVELSERTRLVDSSTSVAYTSAVDLRDSLRSTGTALSAGVSRLLEE